ncbi:hypothetical protein [Burkholderia sp. MSMB0856]|nr:hypothetical protein [Burkholderia sp. MSMB0856]
MIMMAAPTVGRSLFVFVLAAGRNTALACGSRARRFSIVRADRATAYFD